MTGPAMVWPASSDFWKAHEGMKNACLGPSVSVFHLQILNTEFNLSMSGYSSTNLDRIRLQNSPYFCVFKYAQAVKQKVWCKAENGEQDWGETV